MTEHFNVGDKVVYEDANTGETKYGIITSIKGSDGTIRTITRAKIGSTPEPPPRADPPNSSELGPAS
jgi:hypothetical protein